MIKKYRRRPEIIEAEQYFDGMKQVLGYPVEREVDHTGVEYHVVRLGGEYDYEDIEPGEWLCRRESGEVWTTGPLLHYWEEIE